ncbi:kinase-like domain-containing protein [Ganoderma leucocontextum]|nr:kinase-like domain-containing protein [Ganoderma leucocontextum]
MSLVSAPRPVRRDPQGMRLRCKYGPIGFGTFGRVYMALVTNERALRPVALKKVHISDYAKYPPLLHEAAALLRLRGSIFIFLTFRLSHRSIPNVYGWGRSQFFEYLSQELLGPDLRTWFTLEEKPLTSRNLVAIVWQMLDVLEYVHSQGIIHCDIKPSNIMLGRGDNKWRIFLGDFGLSLPFDPSTPPSEPTTRHRGTGYYMSLNNHLHGALSPHDDMESLAYTILELRLGRLPWDRLMPLANIFVTKQRWTGEHWKATTGCPEVYGDFLDSVRDRSQALDYARWKQAFCGNSAPTPPDAEPPYKYDPLDDDAPISRRGYDDAESHKPLAASDLAGVPQNPESWPPLSGSSHGFYAGSTWSGPVTLEEAASCGDERELVLRELALIDRPPICRGQIHPLEVMKRFGDILGENFSSSAAGGDSGDSGGEGNGSEEVDSGYGGSEGEVTAVTPHEACDAFDDSDFRQFYDSQYDRIKG